MPTDEELHEAKRALKERYFDLPGVVGFGIGEGVALVYLLNAEAGDALPKTINGIDVERVVTGEIVAGDEPAQ